ncbi:MAG: hypothetical protein Q9168_005448 [Polycauliona sp. 1 TL-2023]
MALRSTRGSAAKEAAFIASSEKENIPHNTAASAAPASSKKRSPSNQKLVTEKATGTKAKAARTPRSAKSSTKTKLEEEPVPSKKRKRDTTPKVEDDTDDLPHGLGKLWKAGENGTEAPDVHGPATKKEKDDNRKVKRQKKTTPSTKTAEANNKAEESPAKKPRKKKANPYGLTPGMSPFPDWPHPTPEECQEVNNLLSSIHGKVKIPDTIPKPSATVAGCGEVPSVLDALIRTLLSAATSGTNSSRAFQGLIEEYGRKKTGIGKGSVDWDAVRCSDVSRVFKAIKSGGLADVKSKKIKLILDMVHEENQARRNAFVKADHEPNAEKASTIAPKAESDEAKKTEIQGADENVLSLDYLHSLPTQESFNHMLKYPGIGVKTASCVTMFCLRRPSFAVDTHVFRLCQWLGWVPEKANRDTTFMHCEVMVPDPLKYSLHQLLIQHGKKCGRCRAITGESSEGWGKGCVIDHLVKRTGARKGGGGASPAKANKKKRSRKGGAVSDDDDDAEETQGTDTETENSEDDNIETSTSTRAKRVTPRKRPTKAKQEDSGEEEETQESDAPESDFKPPAKKSKTTSPKKKGSRSRQRT